MARKHASMRKKMGGYGMKRDGQHLEGHEMEPHNMMRGVLMAEDHSKPCSLPYGAHSKEVERHPNMGLAAHPNDLFLGVQEKMKADFEGLRRLTKPTNW